MCGIAGYFTSGKQLSKESLEGMTTCLKHRGPDSAGYFHNGHTGLGHRRLSIIDLSTGSNQPMYSADGRYVIIFNGEIYNFQEIDKELNVTLQTTGDTEVILEAYVQWGPSFVNRLNGMFALAIYDLQANTLFICRDRLGIKPIYYYHHNGLFAFASELKALTGFAELSGKLSVDYNSVKEFLYLGYVPTPNSIYSEIKKFPQGYTGFIDGNNNLTLTPYWVLREKVTNNLITDEAEAKKQLNELVNSAVKYRMIADVPFGTFLSGGVDSSLVTAVAQRNSSVPINTFSIGFKESSFNEAEHARKVAQHLGTKHHEFMVSYQEAIDLFEDIIDVYDEPFADSSSVPTMLVSKLARQHVTMTLSGDGGDETYLGYGFYNWAQRLNNPVISALRGPIATALSFGDNRKQRAALMFKYPNKARLKSHIFSQEQYYFGENDFDQYLTPALNGKSRIRMDEDNHVAARKLSPAEEQAVFDMRYYLPDDLLVKVDRASMKYSLEARVPLLDYRLVEFALNVDPSLKMKDGNLKYLLKQVLYDYVPKELFDRPKWGFGMPINQWLKKELKHLIDEYTRPELIQKAGLMQPEAVKTLVAQYLSGKDYLYNRVWLTIILHRWWMKNAGEI
ncbi:asparagine synthase (glutamine-hydrolyzing) [soil metagenome]